MHHKNSRHLEISVKKKIHSGYKNKKNIILQISHKKVFRQGIT